LCSCRVKEDGQAYDLLLLRLEEVGKQGVALLFLLLLLLLLFDVLAFDVLLEHLTLLHEVEVFVDLELLLLGLLSYKLLRDGVALRLASELGLLLLTDRSEVLLAILLLVLKLELVLRLTLLLLHACEMLLLVDLLREEKLALKGLHLIGGLKELHIRSVQFFSNPALPELLLLFVDLALLELLLDELLVQQLLLLLEDGPDLVRLVLPQLLEVLFILRSVMSKSKAILLHSSSVHPAEGCVECAAARKAPACWP